MVVGVTEIKDIRKKLGMTQSQLAKQSSVSQSLIAKIEAGRLDPTYSNATKIFDALDNASKRKELKAEEIMSAKMSYISPESGMKDAIKKMKSYGFSQLPVVSEHKAVGMISESIILEALMGGKKGRVEDIMESAPPVVSFDTTISAVSNFLKYFPMVLVSKKGNLIGVITKTDLLDKMYK